MKEVKEFLDRYRVVNELYNIAEDVRKKMNTVRELDTCMNWLDI